MGPFADGKVRAGNDCMVKITAFKIIRIKMTGSVTLNRINNKGMEKRTERTGAPRI